MYVLWIMFGRQVSPQLSWDDTCQIWTWYSKSVSNVFRYYGRLKELQLLLLVGVLGKWKCHLSQNAVSVRGHLIEFGSAPYAWWRSPVDTLQWHHNGRDSVSNHQPHDCLFNRLFRCRSKKTPKLRVTGLCTGNSPGTGNILNCFKDC